LSIASTALRHASRSAAVRSSLAPLPEIVRLPHRTPLSSFAGVSSWIAQRHVHCERQVATGDWDVVVFRHDRKILKKHYGNKLA